jgi:hypothetical protein
MGVKKKTVSRQTPKTLLDSHVAILVCDTAIEIDEKTGTRMGEKKEHTVAELHERHGYRYR